MAQQAAPWQAAPWHARGALSAGFSLLGSLWGNGMQPSARSRVVWERAASRRGNRGAPRRELPGKMGGGGRTDCVSNHFHRCRRYASEPTNSAGVTWCWRDDREHAPVDMIADLRGAAERSWWAEMGRARLRCMEHGKNEDIGAAEMPRLGDRTGASGWAPGAAAGRIGQPTATNVIAVLYFRYHHSCRRKTPTCLRSFV